MTGNRSKYTKLLVLLQGVWKETKDAAIQQTRQRPGTFSKRQQLVWPQD